MSSVIQTFAEIKSVTEQLPTERKGMLIDSLMELSESLIDKVITMGTIPDRFSKALHPAMLAQLEAAETRTENGADDIMTAAEELTLVAGSVGGDDGKKIQDCINKIFEASSFQDLVVQHIDEVRRLIEDLKIDIEAFEDLIKELFGDEQSAGSESYTKELAKRRAANKDVRPDSELLNGPSVNVKKRS